MVTELQITGCDRILPVAQIGEVMSAVAGADLQLRYKALTKLREISSERMSS